MTTTDAPVESRRLSSSSSSADSWIDVAAEPCDPVAGAAACGEPVLAGGASAAAPAAAATIQFQVNGRTVTVANPDPSTSLGAYIREELGFKGTKLSCEQGGCGACVIARVGSSSPGDSDADPAAPPQVQSINSCLFPLPAADGLSFVTAEGIVQDNGLPHPVQKTLADKNGSQCGFCSPGFGMEMWSLLQGQPKPTGAEIEGAFDGHLCRCTGYRPILDAMQTFAADSDEAKARDARAAAGGSRGPPCAGVCASRGSCAGAGSCAAGAVGADIEDVLPYDPSIDARLRAGAPRAVAAGADRGKTLSGGTSLDRLWVSPTSLEELFAAIDAHAGQDVRIVGGNTGSGIYLEANTFTPRVLVYTKRVAELLKREVTDRGIHLGAARTLTDLEFLLREACARKPGAPTQPFESILRHMKHVANAPVRNEGTWAGNLALEVAHRGTSSPFQSDIATIMIGAGATVTLAGRDGYATVPLEELSAALLENRVIAQLSVPFAPDGFEMHTEKVMLRHQNSHALVNCALSVTRGPGDEGAISAARAVFGGVWSYCGRAGAVETALEGGRADAATLSSALSAVAKACVPDPEQPRAAYRALTAQTVFYKLFLRLFPDGTLPAPLRSATGHFLADRPISSGKSLYPVQPDKFPLYQALPAISAVEKTMGAAEFADDLPFPRHGLYAALVTSTVARAKIVSIDFEPARAVDGFVGAFSAEDIPGSNSVGEVMPGKELFASTEVIFLGQSLGCVVATSYDAARNAARAVKVEYASVERPVVGLDGAKAAGTSFDMSPWLGPLNPIQRGSIDDGLAASDHTLETTFEIGSQYAFYMENQSCVVVPGELGSLSVRPSTQAPRDMGIKMATVLGTTTNKIDVRMMRTGGGFGSKGSMSEIPACACAVAATKLGVPVKIYLDKTTDFRLTGKRHPYRGTFRVGYNNDGTIGALEMVQDIDGGNCLDETVFTASLSQLTCDNNYNVPNFVSQVNAWRTNTASNTSVRAPGAIQVAALIEHVVEEVAARLGVPPASVQEANFYRVTDPPQVTPYGQPITTNAFEDAWSGVLQSSGFSAKRAAADAFNAANRWRKRGVYAAPIKYGVGSAGVQGGALVSIAAADGSVTVSHGASELGQGAETKIAQAVAAELGVPLSSVRVTATNTRVVANALQTGGSVSSNVNAAAALDACKELNTRLKPLRTAGQKWADLVASAWAAGVNLQALAVSLIQPGSGIPAVASAAGGDARDGGAKIIRRAPVHPRRGLVHMPPDTAGAPPPFNYSAYGASVTEVEVDILTGQVQVLSTDMFYDCGTSPNPLLDVGQIQGCLGSFGIGHFLTEEVLTDDTGRLTTDSTWTYKPPSTLDIPIDFNVTLLSGAPNKPGTFGSASAGEPPLFGALSIFFAVKQAVRAARADAGLAGTPFTFDAPATVDKILMACGVTPDRLVVQ